MKTKSERLGWKPIQERPRISGKLIPMNLPCWIKHRWSTWGLMKDSKDTPYQVRICVKCHEIEFKIPEIK